MNSLYNQLGRWIRSSGLVFLKLIKGCPAHESRSADPRHSLGREGERLAVKFLKQLGHRVVACGYRTKLGEIDIITVDSDHVVFVEVKTWRGAVSCDPSAAVDVVKQGKLTRAALTYLKQNRLLNQPARFDVISIVVSDTPGAEPQIRHFKNAFEALGHGQLFR